MGEGGEGGEEGRGKRETNSKREVGERGRERVNISVEIGSKREVRQGRWKRRDTLVEVGSKRETGKKRREIVNRVVERFAKFKSAKERREEVNRLIEGVAKCEVEEGEGQVVHIATESMTEMKKGEVWRIRNDLRICTETTFLVEGEEREREVSKGLIKGAGFGELAVGEAGRQVDKRGVEGRRFDCEVGEC